ncbi:MAG: hypothetical protein AAB847_01640, partial [Patescibacteria group bacterium]
VVFGCYWLVFSPGLATGAIVFTIVALLLMPFRFGDKTFTAFGNVVTEGDVFAICSLCQVSEKGNVLSLFGALFQRAEQDAVVIIGLALFQKAGRDAIVGLGLALFQKAERDALVFIGLALFQKAKNRVEPTIGLSVCQRVDKETRTFSVYSGLTATKNE